MHSAFASRALLMPILFALAVTSSLAAEPSASRDDAAALPSAFDPARDAEADLRTAVRIAGQTHRLVLLYVGGDWCESCRRLDQSFAHDPDLAARRDAAFVLLRVNYSSANKNAKLLSRMPFFFGYPHWFLIDRNGRVVHSSFAIDDRREFEQFADKWSDFNVSPNGA